MEPRDKDRIAQGEPSETPPLRSSGGGAPGPTLECVPNFSFGRDPDLLESLVKLAGEVPGVCVLDRSLDPDHNRAVLTFAGTPSAVEEAAFRLVAAAAQAIDLTKHTGVHPRIGATDVVPLIPLSVEDRQLAVETALRLGRRIGEELRIPVYFYGDAARRPERHSLAALRRGGFEGLQQAVIRDATRRPDAGPLDALHPTAGATTVGVRSFLVAFNIDLETRDVGIAREIAADIREAGGGLPGLRALGLLLERRGVAQVSMNITDHERLTLTEVFETVQRLANQWGVEVQASELIGLAPAAALDASIAKAIRLRDFDPTKHIFETRLRAASATETNR